MAQPLPQTIGTYRIIAKLGQGGMARVLLAMRQGRAGFRKLFVIKELRADLLEQPEFLEMFFDEARLAALLNHPNVVQTHEIIEEEGECAIAMEYLEGQPLSRLQRRATPAGFPLALHVYILTEVLAGLHYAHDLADLSGEPLNVVHRDVSPGNIFLTYDGQVKLLDFGIAKAAGANTQTRVGGIKGKLHYMAPEQAKAEPIDRRTDLFSVGVLLWEALAEARLVPKGELGPVTLNNRVNGLWPSISEIKPDAPPELIAACDKAMALDPKDRFASCEHFRKALLTWLEAQGEVPGREEVAEMVTRHFARDRALLADKIAAKIDEDMPYATDEALLSKTALTQASLAPSGASASAAHAPTDGLLARATQPPRSRGKKRLFMSLGLLAAIGGALLFFVMTRGPGSTEAASNGDQSGDQRGDRATQSASDNTQARPGKTIELYVSASPRSATIALDGKALDGNPFRGEVPLDGQMHEVEVSADGYESSTRQVHFTSDIHIELGLIAMNDDADADADDGSDESRDARRTPAERARAKARARAREKARAKARASGSRSDDDTQKDGSQTEKTTETTKSKDGGDPKAGDVLTRTKKDDSREIDEENPYQ